MRQGVVVTQHEQYPATLSAEQASQAAAVVEVAQKPWQTERVRCRGPPRAAVDASLVVVGQTSYTAEKKYMIDQHRISCSSRFLVATEQSSSVATNQQAKAGGAVNRKRRGTVPAHNHANPVGGGGLGEVGREGEVCVKILPKGPQSEVPNPRRSSSKSQN